MVTTLVLMRVERERVNAAAERLAELEGVSEVYSVAGRYDLVAVVRVPDNDALARVVTEQMAQVPGLQRTETLIAFRAFSRHDLEQMFSLGFEG